MNELLNIKSEIEKLLESAKINGNLSSLINSLARHKVMRKKIELVTPYVDIIHHPTKKIPKAPMSLRVYCILNYIINEESIPKCKCGKPKAFDSMERGFRLSCGNRSCYQSIPEVVNKKHKTVIKNFGSLKKGYDNAYTIKNKYGADNCSQLDWVKEKKIETSRKNWGTDYPWQTEEGKLLQKQGVQKKWSVDNISQHSDIKEKKIETSRKNWNTDNPSQHPYVRSKILEKNGYPYKLPSGNIVMVDSVSEEKVIDLLLTEYHENKLIVQPNIAIKYQDVDKNEYVWFPDMLTIPENRLIEIKTYGMMGFFETGDIWYQLCGGVNSGYEVELFVVKDDDVYRFIPTEQKYTWDIIDCEGYSYSRDIFDGLDKFNFFIKEDV